MDGWMDGWMDERGTQASNARSLLHVNHTVSCMLIVVAPLYRSPCNRWRRSSLSMTLQLTALMMACQSSSTPSRTSWQARIDCPAKRQQSWSPQEPTRCVPSASAFQSTDRPTDRPTDRSTSSSPCACPACCRPGVHERRTHADRPRQSRGAVSAILLQPSHGSAAGECSRGLRAAGRRGEFRARSRVAREPDGGACDAAAASGDRQSVQPYGYVG